MHETPNPAGPSKAALRASMRSLLRAVTAEDAATWSEMIAGRVLSDPMTKSVRWALLYLPLSTEPDVRVLEPDLRRAGIRIAVPRPDWERGTMEPVEVESLRDGLVADRHGLRRPPAGAPVVPVESLDLVLAPGLAFDRRGNRLGRGAGFYDRLVSQPRLRALVRGVAFHLQIVPSVPVEEHDTPMQGVITERESIRTDPATRSTA